MLVSGLATRVGGARVVESMERLDMLVEVDSTGPVLEGAFWNDGVWFRLGSVLAGVLWGSSP